MKHRSIFQGNATTVFAPIINKERVPSRGAAASSAAETAAEPAAGAAAPALLRQLAAHLPGSALFPVWLRLRLASVLGRGAGPQRRDWVRCRLLALSLLGVPHRVRGGQSSPPHLLLPSPSSPHCSLTFEVESHWKV